MLVIHHTTPLLHLPTPVLSLSSHSVSISAFVMWSRRRQRYAFPPPLLLSSPFLD